MTTPTIMKMNKEVEKKGLDCIILIETTPTTEDNILQSRKMNFDVYLLTDTNKILTKDQFISHTSNYSQYDDTIMQLIIKQIINISKKNPVSNLLITSNDLTHTHMFVNSLATTHNTTHQIHAIRLQPSTHCKTVHYSLPTLHVDVLGFCLTIFDFLYVTARYQLRVLYYSTACK